MIGGACSDGTVVAFLAKTWAMLNVLILPRRIPTIKTSSAGTPKARSFEFWTWMPSSDTSYPHGFAIEKSKVSSGRYFFPLFSSTCMALRRSSVPSIPRVSLIHASPETIRRPFASSNEERNVEKSDLSQRITMRRSNNQ